MSFLTDVFDKEFYVKLKKRRKTFRKAFELLEEKGKDSYLIVETGCARHPNNWGGDGMSTVVWDAFVNYYDGKVISVDKAKSACENARKLISYKTEVFCSDSVCFLWKFEPPADIDLLYLDSYGLNQQKPHPSSLHHIKELCAVISKLKEGTIIMIDDHINEKVGKGAYVSNFMEHLGYKRVIDGYQIGWVL